MTDFISLNLAGYVNHYISLNLPDYDAVLHGTYTIENGDITAWNLNELPQPTKEVLGQYDFRVVFKRELIVGDWMATRLVDTVPNFAEMKARLLEVYNPEEFNSYSNDVKTALALSFAVDKESRLTVLSPEEEVKASGVYNQSMYDHRKKEVKIFVANIYNTMENPKVIVGNISSDLELYALGVIDSLESISLVV